MDSTITWIAVYCFSSPLLFDPEHTGLRRFCTGNRERLCSLSDPIIAIYLIIFLQFSSALHTSLKMLDEGGLKLR